MKKLVSISYRQVIGLSILLGLFFAIAFGTSQYQQNIDRFYHFAISKLVIQNGSPATISSLPHLGWHKAFPEKEFLFHQFTALGFLFGQEQGVRIVALGVASILISVLFIFASKRLSLSLSLLLVSCLVFFEPYFVFRLVLIRPHLLAILFTLLALISCLSGRVFLAGTFGLLFSLSYHAFYLPLGVFSLFAVFTFGIKPKRYSYSAFAAIFGVLIGIILNPYFPASLSIGLEHLFMALSPPRGIPLYFVGSELLKPRWSQVIEVFYPALILVFLSAILLFVEARRINFETKLEEDEHVYTKVRIRICSFLVFTTFLLWGLGKINPRAFEYALPISILTICSVLEISSMQLLKRGLPILLLTFCILKTPATYAAFKQVDSPLEKRIQGGLNALSSLSPQQGVGTKIFNCHWDLGSLILYKHPKAEFIDLLDPRLFHYYDPKLSKLRLALIEARVENPVEVISRIFKADYILCSSTPLHSALESSKQLERVYPSGDVHAPPEYTPGLRPALYKIIKTE